MTDKEFYASILARVLIEAGAGIIVGGDDSDKIVRDMANQRCCETLRKIQNILDDNSLSDKDCFNHIEQIVSIFEQLGPGAGSRHDFG